MTQPSPDQAVAPPSSTRRLILAAACAAAVAICLVGGYFGYKWWNGSPQDLSTTRDTPKEFVLGDGTHVMLDAGSELVVQLGWYKRTVSLERGEALFTVTHDASRSFEVDIQPSGKIVDNVGARFDVDSLRRTTRVSVLKGRIDMSTAKGSVALAAGQSGGYSSDGALLPVGTADDSVIWWVDGERRFQGESLSDVLDLFGRYHDVSFVFTDSKLQDLQVGGLFYVHDLRSFLQALTVTFPVQIHQINSRWIEISPRPVTAPAAKSRAGH